VPLSVLSLISFNKGSLHPPQDDYCFKRPYFTAEGKNIQGEITSRNTKL
jgi:hypothetical protein